MKELLSNPVFILIVFLLLMFGMIFSFVSAFVNFRKNLKSVPEALEDESLKEPTAKNAIVLSKRTGGHYEGSHKQPAYINDYYVTFLTDNQKEIEYSVFKEAFEKITIGQSGTLITVSGEFFDFGDGEEITE